MGSYIYFQHGNRLNMNDIKTIMKSNAAANSKIHRAQTNYAFSSIFGFSGGFLVGYPIGSALAGKDANWALAGIGAGLIAISIPFSTAYSRHTKSAVDIYNRNLQTTSFAPRSELRLGMTAYGPGLQWRF